MGLSVKLMNDLSDGVKGQRNLITDVAGVKVGQVTIDDGDVHSGVTAILSHPGNLFRHKVPAASCVLNGFGKSVGLVQIDELGTIETPSFETVHDLAIPGSTLLSFPSRTKPSSTLFKTLKVPTAVVFDGSTVVSSESVEVLIVLLASPDFWPQPAIINAMLATPASAATPRDKCMI